MDTSSIGRELLIKTTRNTRLKTYSNRYESILATFTTFFYTHGIFFHFSYHIILPDGIFFNEAEDLLLRQQRKVAKKTFFINSQRANLYDFCNFRHVNISTWSAPLCISLVTIC